MDKWKNTCLVPLCATLFWQAILNSRCFLGFTVFGPFYCKPATNVFGVCCVLMCVVHFLETGFWSDFVSNRFFACIFSPATWTPEGFLGFVFFGQKCVMLVLCFWPAAKFHRCPVMVSFLGIWIPDGCFGVRDFFLEKWTHCFWRVLSLTMCVWFPFFAGLAHLRSVECRWISTKCCQNFVLEPVMHFFFRILAKSSHFVLQSCRLAEEYMV